MSLSSDDKQWIEALLENRIEARLERMETKLLTAFHEWAQTYEVRARGLVMRAAEFEERLGFIEERVAKLERRGHAE